MLVKVKIDGTTPLIMNMFSDAAALKASGGTRSAIATTDRGTPEEIAESKIYRDLDGKPCIPQPNLLRGLVDGGQFHKAGKKQITTQKSSLLYACLDIEGATVRLTTIAGGEPRWEVDTRPVKIPATGGRILCHRPIWYDWSLSFVLDVDIEIISVALLRQIVDDAGKRIGLGDFRPATKGPFGRFTVVLWQQVKQPVRVAAE